MNEAMKSKWLTREEQAERLVALRSERRLSIDELAVASGLDRDEVARLEAGERGYTVADLTALSDALGVPVDSLLHADTVVTPLFRNEGGDEAGSRAVTEFGAIVEDFFTLEAATRR